MPEIDWLNTPDPHVQYTHDAPEKLLRLIREFGSCFDDAYSYWQPPKNPHIVKRRPLWMNQKRMPSEKYKGNDSK